LQSITQGLSWVTLLGREVLWKDHSFQSGVLNKVLLLQKSDNVSDLTWLRVMENSKFKRIPNWFESFRGHYSCYSDSSYQNVFPLIEIRRSDYSPSKDIRWLDDEIEFRIRVNNFPSLLEGKGWLECGNRFDDWVIEWNHEME
jgi:hypothetical protein